MEGRDWASVGDCRRPLREMDAWAAQGAAVRSHTPLVGDELAGLFHVAAKSSHGASSGLRSVKTSGGTVLTELEEVQQEIFSFYDAIFQGCHAAVEGAEAPVDSSVSFTPDLEAMGLFLPGLPSLSDEQCSLLETPFILGELSDVVQQAASGRSPGLDGLPYEFYKTTFVQTDPPS